MPHRARRKDYVHDAQWRFFDKEVDAALVAEAVVNEKNVKREKAKNDENADIVDEMLSRG